VHASASQHVDWWFGSAVTVYWLEYQCNSCAHRLGFCNLLDIALYLKSHKVTVVKRLDFLTPQSFHRRWYLVYPGVPIAYIFLKASRWSLPERRYWVSRWAASTLFSTHPLTRVFSRFPYLIFLRSSLFFFGIWTWTRNRSGLRLWDVNGYTTRLVHGISKPGWSGA
jgi:hypothetical protein